LRRVSVQADGCQLWTGGKRKDGYGAFMIGRVCLGAHRLAWEMKNGPITDGLFVCHKCDRPACVNPDHMFLGTHTENMKDMLGKGRGRRALGRAHGQSKLTEADVVEIRKSALSTRKMAAVYGVSKSAIFYVRKGVNWKGAGIT